MTCWLPGLVWSNLGPGRHETRETGTVALGKKNRETAAWRRRNSLPSPIPTSPFSSANLNADVVCRGPPTHYHHRQSNQANDPPLSRHREAPTHSAHQSLSPAHHPVIGRQSAHAASDSIYPAAQPVNDALCLAASHRARQWAAVVQIARCLANIVRGEDFYQMCRNEDDKKMAKCEDIKDRAHPE